MALSRDNLAILGKFNFELAPVGIKYRLNPPEGLSLICQNMTLCEMLKAALGGSSFYAGIENHTCDAGLYVLGQKELAEPYINGQFGAGLGVFADERAASRLYQYVPRIGQGVVKYVAFSPWDKMDFDPDILLMLANTTQAEIVLRAMSYKTGQMWQNRYSSAIGCGWLFTYPFINGEINYMPTGMGFGMRRRKLFPEGFHFISIPFDRLPSLLETLQEMPWVPRPYQPDGLEYVRQLRTKLGLD